MYFQYPPTICNVIYSLKSESIYLHSYRYLFVFCTPLLPQHKADVLTLLLFLPTYATLNCYDMIDHLSVLELN